MDPGPGDQADKIEDRWVCETPEMLPNDAMIIRRKPRFPRRSRRSPLSLLELIPQVMTDIFAKEHQSGHLFTIASMAVLRDAAVVRFVQSQVRFLRFATATKSKAGGTRPFAAIVEPHRSFS